jgi:hypothetical protein
MTQTRMWTAWVAGAALVLSGCGATDDLGPGSDPDPAVDTATSEANDGEPTTEETEDGEESDEASGASDEVAAEDSDEADTDWQYVEEFDEPVVWEEEGVRLSITGVGINDVTSDQVPSEVTEFLEDDAQTVVVLEMTVSNDSGQVLNFFPDQGQIQVLREQGEPDFWFSDSVAGSDWPDGVDDDGQIFWVLTSTEWQDAVDAGELTYRADGAFTADFDRFTSDVEVPITWG